MLKIKYRLTLAFPSNPGKFHREIDVKNEDEAIMMVNKIFNKTNTEPNDCVHMEKLSTDYRLLVKVQINGVRSYLTRESEATLKKKEKLVTAIEVDDNWIIEGDSLITLTDGIEYLDETVNDIIKSFNKKSISLERKKSLTVLAEKFSNYEKLFLELSERGVDTTFFKPGMRVIYKERKEEGTVSSVNDKFVFVKFDHLIADGGLDSTTAQACNPESLLELEPSS